MNDLFAESQYEEAAATIRNNTTLRPTVALVLGSGLNSLADGLVRSDAISYQAIPHWPIPTVSGHGARLVLGQMQGRDVLIMQGRVHYYEGFSSQQIAFPVRVMHYLGIQTLIVTNAAGGLNPSFRAGDLMLIQDHINFVGLAGNNPLRGANNDEIGPRFPDMTAPYDRGLRGMAHKVAGDIGFSLREGTYAYVAGPSFETPAEIRFLRLIGADAVGMSTVPAVITARHAGMRVLGVSTITNMAKPDPTPDNEVTHSEVLEVGASVVPRLAALLDGLVSEL